MVVQEKKLEMRGMRRSEIVNYFISIGCKGSGEIKLIGLDWEVEISKENLVSLGSLQIPATIVIFRGRKETLEKMLAAFRLRFLTAGG